MIYYVYVIIGIFACSLSQLLLKKSANKKHTLPIFEILNPMVVIAYGIFMCSLLINIWAMSHGVLLKEMAIFESLGYFFVPILSFLFLKEQIRLKTILSIILIITGIIVFYI